MGVVCLAGDGFMGVGSRVELLTVRMLRSEGLLSAESGVVGEGEK